MNTRVFWILLWKHAMVRKQRLLHTTFEYFGPLMYFLLLYGTKDEIKPRSPRLRLDNTQEQIPLAAMPWSEPRLILYHPDTLLTTMLMINVGARLHLKPLQHFHSEDEFSNINGYYPYTKESQLEALLPYMTPKDAVIKFQQMEDPVLPAKLNYTIRIRDLFFTNSYISIDREPIPHSTFRLCYETFMQIQWAVDTSYIQLRSGNPINQSLYLEEFPFDYKEQRIAMAMICKLLRGICWLSLVLPFVFLMVRLLEERTSGIQELMKIEGVTLNYLGFCHFLNALPPGLIFSVGGAVLLKSSPNPLAENSSGLLIFLMLLLYFNSIIALAFVCSYIATSVDYASSWAVLLYVVFGLPTPMITGKDIPYLATLASGFLPHAPMFWFWLEFFEQEVKGDGVIFVTMFAAAYKNNGSVLLTYAFLLIQATMFYLLAWYLSLVHPGKYGTAQPWYFLFTKKFWTKKVTTADRDTVELTPITHKGIYFEPPPTKKAVGIRVDNVSKEYPNQLALRNVSLEIYQGEITVLVGHNGAGKTTLMSIITGMETATEGNVYVNGKDTVEKREEVRKQLAICPQRNLFFTYLTVQEHLVFFTYLIKGTLAEAYESSNKLMEVIGLSQLKPETLVKDLSNGMKRRVQLACALAGDTDVLILDEPTSGLDVENRRALWNLLLSVRANRTIFLSTHFMEEAEALSDRVAVLHNGQLRCFATTMHLKKTVGSGYHLTLSTLNIPKETEINFVITSYISNALVIDRSTNLISYNLPSNASHMFPGLFTALESKKSELEIESILVCISALEDAFLKLCSEVDTAIPEEKEVNSALTSSISITTARLTGLRLYIRQLRVLFKRQMKYVYSRRWILAFVVSVGMFSFHQVIIPVTMLLIVTEKTNDCVPSMPKALSMPLNLDIYKDKPDRRVLYNLKNNNNISVTMFKDQFAGVKFEETKDIANKVLRVGTTNLLEYNKYLIGIQMDEANVTALYTTTVRHTAPVALNMLSNLLASRYIPTADSRTITTNNHPLIISYNMRNVLEQPKTKFMSFTWGVCVTAIILVTNINGISLPCKEKETSSRHIHIMSGCPAELYWGTTLIFQLALCVITVVLPTILFAVMVDANDTINQLNFIVAFFTVSLLGSMSFFAFMYLVTFNFAERTTSIILVACVMVFGIFTPSLKIVEELFGERSIWAGLVFLGAHVMPPYALAVAAIKCTSVARLNTWCNILRDHCPNVTFKEVGFNSETCCAGEDISYFSINYYSPVYEICLLLVQFVIYMTMVILTQRGIFNGLVDHLMNRRYKRIGIDTDKLVHAEINYVKKTIALPPKQITDAMLVGDVHKTYVPMFRKKVSAVKGVSFSVKQGECFGLLGLNGAGKSTIFKILTAEECPTRGRVFADGYFLKRGNTNYLQSICYCPQLFGLDMFQTGEDNLALILTLRGFDQMRMQKEIRNWIDYIGLSKYKHRVISEYSGGCIRRLGVAVALCGGAPIVLLDEPTTGVDVMARRRLWSAIQSAQRHNRSTKKCVTDCLSSAQGLSMEEMEKLCSRIAILSDGRICALGNSATLRSTYAKGHSIIFNIRSTTVSKASIESETQLLHKKLQEKFNCKLKDKHQTMLHYYIKKSVPYSELFTHLEALKQLFPTLIEDYSVSETTLEEVFLSFAAEQEIT